MKNRLWKIYQKKKEQTTTQLYTIIGKIKTYFVTYNTILFLPV